jgi:hypothetical protein
MQPRNLPAAAGLELLLDDGLLGGDVLFPQAAASRAATTSAALAGRVFLTGYLLFPGHHCRLLPGRSSPPERYRSRGPLAAPSATQVGWPSQRPALVIQRSSVILIIWIIAG